MTTAERELPDETEVLRRLLREASANRLRKPSTRRVPTHPPILGGLALILFLMIAVDVPVHQLFAGLDPAVRDTLGGLTDFGRSTWYLIISGILGLVSWWSADLFTRRHRAALRCTAGAAGFVFVAIASSGLLVNLLKILFGRARPKLFEDLGHLHFAPASLGYDFASMPSGHANTIIAAALAFGFLLPRVRPWLLAIAAWVAFTRVMIGAHYPSDILAGALLAVLTTYAWRNALASRRLVFTPRADGRVGIRGGRVMRGATRDLRNWILRMERPPDVLEPTIGSGLADVSPPVVVRSAMGRPLDADGEPLISVVIPMRDEAPNVRALLGEIALSLKDRFTYEVVCVDDGSIDSTWTTLTGAKADHPGLRCLKHERSSGQSAGIRTAVRAARGRIIVTLDGDGQNDPADIPKLVEAILDPGAPPALGMVAGQRAVRRDDGLKRLASRVANAIRRRALDDGVRDTGCALKAFHREAFLALPYFDHMHRFLPALMRREGFAVRLVDVAHRPRNAGHSKYGITGRALSGIIDLLGVMWLTYRRPRAIVTREE